MDGVGDGWFEGQEREEGNEGWGKMVGPAQRLEGLKPRATWRTARLQGQGWEVLVVGLVLVWRWPAFVVVLSCFGCFGKANRRKLPHDPCAICGNGCAFKQIKRTEEDRVRGGREQCLGCPT